MANNSKLHTAKVAKNDEFYTQLSDVSAELKNYKDHFAGKVVFCNCDDPVHSAFWRYFHLNFERFGLKKLISTHYDKTEPTYKMEYEGGNDNDVNVGVKTPLQGNGDFRNQECLDLLDEADIVVTNPPFSMFRTYIRALVEHDKKFIIVGNINAITYKEVFPLLRENKVWMGSTYFSGGAAYFIAPAELYDPEKMSNPKNAYMKDGLFYWRVNGVRWFTNLDHSKRHEKIILWKHYTPEEYPHYDNYEAIDVSKVSDIPSDYDGEMGVPISFLDKYNPDQFEIIGEANHGSDNSFDLFKPTINGKERFKRIVIRRKTESA